SETNYAFVSDMRDSSYFAFENFDLKNVDGLQARVAANEAGLTLQVRLNSVDGDIIAEAAIPATGSNAEWTSINLPLRQSTGVHTLYFVTRGKSADAKAAVDWIYFQNSQTEQRVASR
ncbi:MAG: carbohydrate-binding protein, partial [Tunicatimonas sp.]|uniref:carbohydrate-binding protein n=1 Tax=Tunicatimonas sp. TaxID=1940096 RepID=UPI003C75741C